MCANKANWLIIGPTQTGKSSFIKLLHEYCEERADIGVGDGTSAKTLNIRSYPLSINIGDSYIEQLNQQIPSTDRWVKAYTSKDHCSLKTGDELKALDAKIRSKNHKLGKDKGETFDMEIVDTPGLDHCGVPDHVHMYKIMSRLSEMQEVAGIIIIKNSAASYSESLVNTIQYYLKHIPDLLDRIIVVHTRWGIREEASCINGTIKKENSISVFNRTFNAIKPAHIFLDNLPETLMEKWLCYTAINTFANKARAYKNKRIHSLRIFKSSDMLNIDLRIVDILTIRMRALKKEILRIDRKQAPIIALTAELEDTKSRVDGLRDEIRKLSTDERVKIAHSSVDEPPVWWWCHHVFDLKSPEYEITDVNLACMHNAWWKDEFRSSHKFRISLHSNFAVPINGTVTIYTTSKIKNAKKIEDLNREIRKVEARIFEIEKNIKLEKVKLNAAIEESSVLESKQRLYASVSEKIKYRYMEVQTYVALVIMYNSLYGKDLASTDTDELVGMYTGAHKVASDEDLARACKICF